MYGFQATEQWLVELSKLVAAPIPKATSSVHKEKEFESRSVWKKNRVFSASWKINLLRKF